MAGLEDILKFLGGGYKPAKAKPSTTNKAPARAPARPTPAPERDYQREYWLKGIDTSGYKGEFPSQIGGYRADPKGKYGGKHGLETMPTNLYAPELFAKVRAMRMGEQYGVPQLSPEQLAAIALKEGNGLSGVFGVDPVWDRNNPDPNQRLVEYDPHMKGDKELFDRLIQQGINPGAAAFAVRLANKQKVAQRLGIPLASAWVGTGHSGYESSNEYANAMGAFERAAAHERNKDLLNFIRTAYGPAKTKKRKAEGGVVIDDGNPAKRRKLI